MVARLHALTGRVALLSALIAAGPAIAQANRPWVDPPAKLTPAPPAPAPQTPTPQLPAPETSAPPEPKSQAQEPPPPTEAQAPERQPERQPDTAPLPAAPSTTARPAAPPPPPPERAIGDAQSEASRRLVVDYLRAWSAPNDDALDAMAEFYAPEVLFHGRSMDQRRLMREKTRFVRRWPERNYRAEEDTIQVICKPQGDTCMVQSLFDFTAANPRRDRRTQGTGALQLTLSFFDGRPLIASESSMVLDQSSGDDELPPEDSLDD